LVILAYKNHLQTDSQNAAFFLNNLLKNVIITNEIQIFCHNSQGLSDLGEEVAFGSATSPKTNFKAILKSPDFLVICHTFYDARSVNNLFTSQLQPITVNPLVKNACQHQQSLIHAARQEFTM
jgi:hypothetical protein